MFVTQRYSPNFGSQQKNHTKKLWILALGIFSCILIVIGMNIKSNSFSSALSSQIFDVGPTDVFETPISLFDNFFATSIRVYDEIQSGENLFSALRRLKVHPAFAERFVGAIGKAINLKLLLPGNAIMLESAANSVQLSGIGNVGSLVSTLTPKAIELFSKDENGVAYRIRAQTKADAQSEIEVTINKPKVYKDHTILAGQVTNTIYGSIIANQGDAYLVNSFSDIFNWQFDFYRDTREGDTYQMIVERNVSEGRFVGYGRVLAAEYVSGNKSLRGFYFESRDGQVSGFFDDQGRSLKNAFLKAPLKLASISSRFGMRFHPVQKRMKPHNGVDYGAVRGTPFMAVASGVVINAGYNPFNGNFVKIRHMNGYETEYLHATHLAKGVRVGSRVKQGQVIGYVGKTGLATGYHLHFGMKQNGTYVNPASQRFARSPGVPQKYMTEFAQSIEAMVIALNRQGPNSNQILALR